jgi:prolyl-tRNA synthetase
MESLIDSRYPLEGFFIRKPNFMDTLRCLERELNDLFEVGGYKPVLFPTLIPEWVIAQEVSHIEGFKPSVYWVTEIGENKKLKEKLALAISSETIFCLAFKNWLSDGLSLPLKFYQRRNVFRAENNDISPLMREREFIWIEAHTAFKTEQECYEQVHKDKEIVDKFLSRFGLFADFSKRPEDDRCPGAVVTYGFDLVMPDGRKNQIASTHFLGQKFSKAFEVKLGGNEDDFVFQTSFGIGLSRVIASLDAYDIVLTS